MERHSMVDNLLINTYEQIAKKDRSEQLTGWIQSGRAPIC